MKRNLKVGDVFSIPSINYPCLVVKTKLTGGGTGHGPHDIYPDGHCVWYVQLSQDEVDAMKDGELLIENEGDHGELHSAEFFQSGCFNGLIEPKDVTLIMETVSEKNVTIRFKQKTS